jgi:HPr kinase/phosphorylase
VIGAPVDVTQYHMEIRGLGIIHVPSLFGVSSVRGEKELNLVVSLYLSSSASDGLRDPDAKDTVNVLGVQVPHISIPVAPGRALPHLVEAAALDQKLRMLGHDAAKELDAKLIRRLSRGASHDG